jgi:hypothetical protein
MTENPSINIKAGRDISGVLNLGTIGGDVNNAINQLPVVSEPDKFALEQLLSQLQEAIQTEAKLSSEDKAEALEQVKTLAEAGQRLRDSNSQKAAKTAIKILKGTAVDLTESPLKSELGRLLPMISDMFSDDVLLSNSGSTSATDQALPVKSILLLAANPQGTPSLRLDEEARELQSGLERSRYRDQFRIHQRWAVTPTEVRRALLDIKPSIIHFSGHGVGSEKVESQLPKSREISVVSHPSIGSEGLMFENKAGQPQLISSEMISNLFSLFSDSIECVVLNACFSENQANEIARFIPYVVGMKRAIGDKAAIQFTVGFYDALLAGESVAFAYRVGCSAIQMEGIPEYLTPVLKQRLT